jgi:hypothetical protein
LGLATRKETYQAALLHQIRPLRDALLQVRQEVVSAWLDLLSIRTAEVQALCHATALLAGEAMRGDQSEASMFVPVGAFVDEREFLDALSFLGVHSARHGHGGVQVCGSQRVLLYLRPSPSPASRADVFIARKRFDRSHPVAFAICIAATGSRVVYDV